MSYELIVMGASWGGLRALREVLAGLPPDFAPAVAIVQHRFQDTGDDGLAGLLGRASALPVGEASDKDPIVPGRASVAPPDYHLLVERGRFALSLDLPEQYSRPSIDVLFESAADAYDEDAVGVILTGGFGVVQDPATAERPALPEAAIAAGGADKVLSLPEIGPFLGQLCRRNGEQP